MKEQPKKLDEVIPAWGEERHVPAETFGMREALARVEEMIAAHPTIATPTATAIVENGVIRALENNGDAHPSFCPRVALGSASGTGYDLCPDHCHSKNHSEVRAAAAFKKIGIDGAGCEAFLAGHYWACMPCWEALRSVGITKLRLVDDADERYKVGRHKNPLSGKLPRSLRVFVDGSFGVNEHAQFLTALTRAGFDVVTLQANPAAEVLVLAPGAVIEALPAVNQTIVDLRTQEDFKSALIVLSRELEPLFDSSAA